MTKIALPCFLLLTAIFSGSCVYRELPSVADCSKSGLNLLVTGTTNASSCKSIDGTITLTATGGTAPYDFSLGNGVYQTNPQFTQLAPGIYVVTVKDKLGCTSTEQAVVAADNSTLTASVQTTADNQCLTNNGSITINAGGGQAPYSYKIDNGTFDATSGFQNLKDGNHSVIIKDSNDCEVVINVVVPRGSTGVSYANEIAPIFAANCNFNGCHSAGTTGRDWTRFSDVKAKSGEIKSRTANRSMPIGGFTLTQTQIDLIGCWVDDGANNN